MAFAVETTAKANLLSDIFEDHGHHVIIEDVTMPEAIRAANDFAANWKEHQTPLPDCDCEEIVLPQEVP